jgi:hypothetical protein
MPTTCSKRNFTSIKQKIKKVFFLGGMAFAERGVVYLEGLQYTGSVSI